MPCCNRFAMKHTGDHQVVAEQGSVEVGFDANKEQTEVVSG